MKANFLFYALFLALASCSSSGFSTDLINGLSYEYKGISVDKVYLSEEDANGIRGHKGKQVAFGTRLGINFKNISGWTAQDGHVDMEINMAVLDTEGNLVKEWLGLFDQIYPDGVPEADAKNFYVMLDMIPPLLIGENYKAELIVKNRMEGVEEQITVEHDFEIVSSEVPPTQ